MRKCSFFGMWLVLAAFKLPVNLSAQEVVGSDDSIWADSVADDNDVDEVIEIVDSAYNNEEDIEVDSVLLAECPMGKASDGADNQRVKKGGNGWMIHSLYFMDMNSWKMRAKYRKEMDEPRWYYYEHDSVDDYEVFSDAANSFLILKTFESDAIAKEFTFHGDTIRIYHYGDYPQESPKYSLLIVTKREGR